MLSEIIPSLVSVSRTEMFQFIQELYFANRNGNLNVFLLYVDLRQTMLHMHRLMLYCIMYG